MRAISLQSNEDYKTRSAKPAPARGAAAGSAGGGDWKRRLPVGATAGVLALVLCAAAAWLSLPSAGDIRAGEQLFAHKWTPNDPLSAAGDGLGPVFNAHSCAECHFQGGIGGGGGLQHNVAAFDVLPTLGHPEPGGGVIHAFATQPDWSESPGSVRNVFPIIPKGATLTAICRTPLEKDYDPIVHHSINTPTLFGAGAIDRIPALALQARHAQRMLSSVPAELALDFKRAGTGRLRILPDGRIGKYGWKAQFATLEEFVSNACAVEVGLTTPTRKQHAPRHHREDLYAKPDLSGRQFRQLVAYVSQLPAPRVALPSDSAERALAERGQELFSTIGCADCHTPDLDAAQGVYSDFCLHDLTDKHSDGYTLNPEVPVPEDFPRLPEWKTPPLWGVAETAPYLHDGSAPTLLAAIMAHGGEARHNRDQFRKLPPTDQAAVLRFLESLVAN